MSDWFVDGHFISAITPEFAASECVRIYNHTPEVIRPWTQEDQNELEFQIQEQDEKFKLLVMSLKARLGRLPTEDEVMNFINGTQAEREAIWNQVSDH